MKVRCSPALWGLFASVFCLSEKLIPLMLLSMISCLYPFFFHIFDMFLFVRLERSFIRVRSEVSKYFSFDDTSACSRGVGR